MFHFFLLKLLSRWVLRFQIILLCSISFISICFIFLLFLFLGESMVIFIFHFRLPALSILSLTQYTDFKEFWWWLKNTVHPICFHRFLKYLWKHALAKFFLFAVFCIFGYEFWGLLNWSLIMQSRISVLWFSAYLPAYNSLFAYPLTLVPYSWLQ